MRPEQFALWLHGYATAKPEVLDEKTREALAEVISGMVANKLLGIAAERLRVLDNERKDSPAYTQTWTSINTAGTPPDYGKISMSAGGVA